RTTSAATFDPYDAAMTRFPAPLDAPSRRALIAGVLGAAVQFTLSARAFAAQPPGFASWVTEFRGRALRRGVSAQTYSKAMGSLEPDMSVFEQFRAQPEFTEA